MDILDKLQIGTQIVYQLTPTSKKEFGIVKRFTQGKNLFVVFDCAEEWSEYWRYSAQNTTLDRVTFISNDMSTVDDNYREVQEWNKQNEWNKKHNII